MTVATANKKWQIHGILLTSSDSIYQKLVSAINADNLSEKHLQRITGSNAPVKVDKKRRIIEFCNF